MRAEYHCFAEAESKRFLFGGEKSFSVTSYNYNDPSPQDMVETANYFFILLCESVSGHMQEYLLEHEGKVRQWADPALPGSFSFESGGDVFEYDYFGASYEVKDGRIVRPDGRTYRNRYQYPERDPTLLLKKLEREFYGRYDREQFLKKESAAAKTAKAELEKAKKKDDAIGDAKMGLILVVLLAVLVGLATARGVGLPVDLQPVMDACYGFMKGVWHTLPKVLNLLVCVLLGIPVYALIILLGIAQTAGTILFDFSALGAAYSVTCFVVLWGAVAAAFALGIHRAFWKNPLPEAQKSFDEAQAALAEKQAEYERIEREFKESEDYRNAQREDKNKWRHIWPKRTRTRNLPSAGSARGSRRCRNTTARLLNAGGAECKTTGRL